RQRSPHPHRADRTGRCRAHGTDDHPPTRPRPDLRHPRSADARRRHRRRRPTRADHHQRPAHRSLRDTHPRRPGDPAQPGPGHRLCLHPDRCAPTSKSLPGQQGPPMTDTPASTQGTTNPLELTVIPSTPVIGAEITGIDLRTTLTPQRGTELRQLLARHKVLFFRGQSTNADQQLALGRSLGSILRFPSVRGEDPAHPGIQIVDNSEEPARRPDGGRYTGGWHIDASGLVIAPFASILRAVRIPPVGGDTVWANLAAAYEGLPDDLTRTIAGL